MCFSSGDGRKISDRVSYSNVSGFLCPRPMCFRREVDRTVAASKQYQSAATLRDTVPHERNRIVRIPIAGGIETIHECSKRLRVSVQSLNSRYVLDEHNVRTTLLDELGEIRKEWHAIVIGWRWMGSVLFRKRLTWGASAKQDRSRPLICDQCTDGGNREFSNVGTLEMH